MYHAGRNNENSVLQFSLQTKFSLAFVVQTPKSKTAARIIQILSSLQLFSILLRISIGSNLLKSDYSFTGVIISFLTILSPGNHMKYLNKSFSPILAVSLVTLYSFFILFLLMKLMLSLRKQSHHTSMLGKVLSFLNISHHNVIFSIMHDISIAGIHHLLREDINGYQQHASWMVLLVLGMTVNGLFAIFTLTMTQTKIKFNALSSKNYSIEKLSFILKAILPFVWTFCEDP